MTLLLVGIATSVLFGAEVSQGTPSANIEEVVVRLTTNKGSDSMPCFGPNGKIAYRSNQGTSSYICTMNADGSDQRAILRWDDPPFQYLSWGPNDEIVFVTLGWDANPFIVRSDGTGLRQLTKFRGNQHMNAVWGEGNKIVFGVDFSGVVGDPKTGYYTITPDGLSMQKLPGTRAGVVGDWSSDGQIFVAENSPGLLIHLTSNDGNGRRYESPPSGISRIYAMEANASGRRRLTFDDLPAMLPRVCKDGRILFSQLRPVLVNGVKRNQWDVMIMDADGTNIQPLTSDPKSDWMGDVSPSGTVLFFSSRSGNNDIYTMKLPERK